MTNLNNISNKKRILVAYATKTNTTAEISEKIAQVIEEKGFEVDVKPIHEVANLTQYSGAIIGSPINGMNWLPEAKQFADSHRETLQKIPTALFYVAYYHGMKRQFWQNLMKKSVYGVKETLHSSEVGMFAGRIEGEPPEFLRMMFGAPKGMPSDRRDWQEITAWAEKVAEIF